MCGVNNIYRLKLCRTHIKIKHIQVSETDKFTTNLFSPVPLQAVYTMDGHCVQRILPVVTLCTIANLFPRIITTVYNKYVH